MPEQTPKPAAGKPAKGKPSPGSEGEYQYLPVECPKCHFEGKVKISRLDRTFTCKQCKKVFHVTLDGTVSGERPHETVVDPAQFVTEAPQGPIAKWLESLPRAGQMALLGLGGLLLAYGVSIWMEPAKPLPGELEDRALFAGHALAKGEWKQLKRLAKAKTAGDLGRWYDLVRPKDWADIPADANVNVELGPQTQQLRGYEKEKPLLDAILPITIEPPGKSKLENLTLHFSQDDGSDWWLDGDRMLNDASAAKKPARKPTPKPGPKAAP